MNPLRALYVVAFLAAAVCAVPNSHSLSSMAGAKLKPSQWLSKSELEKVPSLTDVTVEVLENMPMREGAKVLKTIYHVSQVNNDLKAVYVPEASRIPVYIAKPNGDKETTTLDKLASTANQQPEFGNGEVTIFITGLPEVTDTVKDANRDLVNSYMKRYNFPRHQGQSMDYDSYTTKQGRKNSYNAGEQTTGDIVVIALGEVLTDFKHYAMLRLNDTGALIAKQIVKLNVPAETIHILGQNVAAHVAGEAGEAYKRMTGNKLDRITALDPSELYAKDPETLLGLTRGAAKFVDAIHTSALGMGTKNRVGNVDIYPNGPSFGVPGTDNVIEATMRATEIFAESVRPGNDLNFPAVEGKSLNNYRNNNGNGRRVYVGINTPKDLEGDFILEVNAKRPYGKRAPANKQNSFHGVHSSYNQPKSYRGI